MAAGSRTTHPSAQGLADIGWVMGYVWSANSLYWPDGTLGQGMSQTDIAAWLDDYCSRYPSENLAGASEALITDMAQIALRKQTERLSQDETPSADARRSATATSPYHRDSFSAMPDPTARQ